MISFSWLFSTDHILCKQCMSVHPDLIRHLLGYSQALRRAHFVRLRVPAERLIAELGNDVFLCCPGS
jgi:hypothetical protein